MSGPVSDELGGRIDRDLADPVWREIFHSALRDEPRFRRGFAERGEDAAQFASWSGERWGAYPMSLAEVRKMSCLKLDLEGALAFEYGVMVIKTSAALWYTIQICQREALVATTDSPPQDRLLKRILARDRLQLATYLWRRRPAWTGPIVSRGKGLSRIKGFISVAHVGAMSSRVLLGLEKRSTN